MNKLFLISSLLASILAATTADSLKGEQVLDCQIGDKQKSNALAAFDIWGYDVKANTFTVRVRDSTERKQVEAITKCSVKIADLEAHVKELEAKEQNNSIDKDFDIQSSTADPFFSNYQTYAAIASTLKTWASQNPSIATFTPSIGKSVEGRDIFAFKLTSASGSNKKGIWFNGGLHAREWIAPAATLYSIRKFLDEAETSQVKTLLDTFEFHFTPLANPDGYEYSRTSNRMWRKNRRNNGNNYGVDLNRNWNDHWGVSGSSTNPAADTYQGRSPNSEPEVQALANYALSIPNRYGGIDFHSYGQLVLRNWGWSSKLSENEKLLKPLGDAMSSTFKSKGYTYTSMTSAGLYPASGALDDWMASVAKLVSFTVELCPGDNSSYGFQLPASEIVKCSEGVYAAILTYSNYLKQNPNIPPNKPLP